MAESAPFNLSLTSAAACVSSSLYRVTNFAIDHPGTRETACWVTRVSVTLNSKFQLCLLIIVSSDA